MTLAIKFLVLGVLAVYARAGAVALRRPITDFYVAGRLVPGLFNGMRLRPLVIFSRLASGGLRRGRAMRHVRPSIGSARGSRGLPPKQAS